MELFNSKNDLLNIDYEFQWPGNSPKIAQPSPANENNSTSKMYLKTMENLSQTLNQKKCHVSKPTENPAKWTQSEDLQLFSLVTSPSIKNWSKIAEKIGKKSIEDCQQRWEVLQKNYRVVGAWNFDEQIQLFKLLKKHGFAWKEISLELPMRSSNSIKGFVHASFRKIKKMKKIFWCLNKIARWPTFTNKSK